MYEHLLFIHSWTRWAVLIGAVHFLVRAIKGFVRNEIWSRGDDYFIRVYHQVFGFQVLFGLTLWIGFSPMTKAAFHDFGVMKDNFAILFYLILHAGAMLLALGLFEIARAKAKKLNESKGKFRLYIRSLFAVLFIFFLAIPWPWYSFGRALFRWF